ncbi:MAG: C40 family peptidase [Hyphomicrobium sp.]
MSQGDGESTTNSLLPARVPVALDPRCFAFRDDLAAESLKDCVSAPRYSAGVKRQVLRAAVPVRRRPSVTAGIDTEALHGEIVTQYDEAHGWAWVQLERDRYVGYVPVGALGTEIRPTTHRVKALGTFLYPVPDIKSAPLMHLSLNAALAIAEPGEKFSRTAAGHFVVSRHIVEKDRFIRDYVDIAERLAGTPYLWGGRTRIGLDCSGLVQVSLEAAGIPCPRDSDMQQAELGSNVLVPADLEGLQRGDLVFWKGHVGIMADGIMLLHANAHHMAVVLETLPEAVGRTRRGGSEIVAIKRLSGLTSNSGS